MIALLCKLGVKIMLSKITQSGNIIVNSMRSYVAGIDIEICSVCKAQLGKDGKCPNGHTIVKR